MQKNQFLINKIIDVIEKWLITGEFNADILSNNFQFSSPYWKNINRMEFIKQFGNPAVYKEKALSKITHFNPIIRLKDADEKHFAVVLQYHTKNNNHVYETVFGTVEYGLLTTLKSIYDLDETKKALQL